MVNRREFIAGAAACAGLPLVTGGSSPVVCCTGARRLRLGVLSDLHIHTPRTAETFEHALRVFDAERADAVVVCGDLSDHGVRPELSLVAETWRRVFPQDRRSDGEPIVRLFIYGDHDTGLNPKTLERVYPDAGFRAREDIPTHDRKAIWEETFGEPWEPVQIKFVKGVPFVLYHFNCTDAHGDSSHWAYGQHAWGLPEFLAAHEVELKGASPFFYVQHRVMRNTAGGVVIWGQDDGFSTKALSTWPNAVALFGHAHMTAVDERLAWQGAFTAIEVPSLSYCVTECGRENGFALDDADFREADKVRPVRQMAKIDAGTGHRAVSRQGYVMDVFDDGLCVSRRCFLSDRALGPDWRIPLDCASPESFRPPVRARRCGSPEFPSGAVAEAVRRRGTDRAGRETDQIVVTAPVAHERESGIRAYDYEVQPVVTKGLVRRAALAKRVYPPDILQAGDSAASVTCVFAEQELPSDRDEVAFVITPISAFGVRGRSLTVKMNNRR